MYNAFTPFEASIGLTLKIMRDKRLSSTDLVEYYLHRVRVYDGVVHSIAAINGNVLQEAGILDRELREGRLRGPLHGIPLVVKDDTNVNGMPATSGCRALKDFCPKNDAFIVDRLKKAGAVILAKATLSELAMSGMGVSTLFGQGLNPYDLTRTPGGSSSGTSIAVNCNFCMAGIGTDTVNSVRSPASVNGLVGIRPTRGLVSRSGILPHCDAMDTAGPIARNVADAALLLQIIACYDSDDMATQVIREKELPNYMDHLKDDGLRGKRIGLLQNYIGDYPPVRELTLRAASDMRKLGAAVREIEAPLPSRDTLLQDYNLKWYDTRETMNRFFSCQGENIPYNDLKQMLESGGVPEPMLEELQKAEEVKEGRLHPEYVAIIGRQRKFTEKLLQVMNENDIDVLMFPHQVVLPVPVGYKEGQVGRNGILGAISGFPCIVFPGGFSPVSPTSPQGIPVGMELLTRPFDEPLLIEMAYAYEQYTGHRKPPQAFKNI